MCMLFEETTRPASTFELSNGWTAKVLPKAIWAKLKRKSRNSFKTAGTNGEEYMKKNKIQYGKVDVLPEVIEDKDVTVHISLKIEGDLLKAIRALAEKEHLPYQTKLKQMLRAQLEAEEIKSKI